MASLKQAIRESLINPHSDPWLPDLTTLIASSAEQELRSHTGITSDDYGTERVLAGSAEAPRLVGAHVPILIDVDGTTRQVTVEFLTKASIGTYAEIGLCFRTPDEVANSPILRCLQDALDVLAMIPSLQATVTALIRTCHVLKSEPDTYDVSHSDPRVPFSVFVSVPQNCGPTNALRVAESLVHEAMHLQLTLIEQLQPLVKDWDQTYYSPWKAAWRPPRGVLHALYVFRVLDSIFERLLMLHGWSAASLDHMRGRRYEITQQISEVRVFKDHPALTEVGICFVRLLV